MKFGIISDIHGNLEALEKAIDKLEKLGAKKYVCGGDIVGYGAQPSECIQIIKDLNCTTIAGNHDWAVIGKINADLFNIYARTAVMWTREKLKKDDIEYLESLPLQEKIADFEISHGTVFAPENFDYIQSLEDAQRSFDDMTTNLAFLGHSHVPISFFNIKNSVSYSLETRVLLNREIKTMVNVGSIGQPRDENPRASCALYDDEKDEVQILRIDYDIEKSANSIIEAGLPKILALRLYEGK